MPAIIGVVSCVSLLMVGLPKDLQRVGLKQLPGLFRRNGLKTIFAQHKQQLFL